MIINKHLDLTNLTQNFENSYETQSVTFLITLTNKKI